MISTDITHHTPNSSSDEPLTIGSLIRQIRSRISPFFDRGEREAIIRLIFHHLKGWSQTDIIIHEDRPASDFLDKEVNAITDRLILGEPIQYILGEAYFYGMDLKVCPGVLIPRPETAEMVDMIIDENKRDDLHVLDIGTGSGCIAIALARNLPFSEVAAIDVSATAVAVAIENAAALKTKIKVEKADMYRWIPESESLDIVVSNPPYILPSEKSDLEVRVKDFEPDEALFTDGHDPLRPYRRIEAIASAGLRPGGRVYLELNPLYAYEVKSLFSGSRWQDAELLNDSYGKIRFLRAVTAKDYVGNKRHL